MTKMMLILGLALPLAMASRALAQDEENRPRRDGEMRRQMIEEFDADGDGELNDEERQTARETMRERRGDRPRRGGRGGEGGGGEGRPVPPDPNKLFDEFDADKDGQLSRDEFMKLTEAQRDRRPPRPPRQGRPGRPPRDGEFGPPPRPLENQFDGPPGPPREGEFVPPPRDGEFDPPPGPRDSRGRGPEGRGRGPEGFGGPDPSRMFDRFDEDGDDQLSREEFTRLTDRLREMRERFAEGGQRGRGPRGPGFGPPRRGGPEGERPPRPQRPEEGPNSSDTAEPDSSSV